MTQSKDENKIKGSGRSIEEYNMFDEISKAKDLLTSFGGHPMAAGLSLNKSNLEDFRNRLNGQTTLTEKDLIPKIYIDIHLPLDYVSFNLVKELKLLEPFGKGNPKPLFGAKGIPVKRAFILGKNGNVLKLSLLTKSGRIIDGLYFGDIEEFENRLSKKYGMAELDRMYKGIDSAIKLDIVYTPSVNEYMGNKNLQVIIHNYR